MTDIDKRLEWFDFDGNHIKVRRTPEGIVFGRESLQHAMGYRGISRNNWLKWLRPVDSVYMHDDYDTRGKKNRTAYLTDLGIMHIDRVMDTYKAPNSQVFVARWKRLYPKLMNRLIERDELVTIPMTRDLLPATVTVTVDCELVED